MASGSDAQVILFGTISGGKLQTQAGGEIISQNGLLSNTTIASGSIVDVQGGGKLALAGRINNLGMISALGSFGQANVRISGTAVLSGGGQVLLSPGFNNQIVAIGSNATLSNVNNTIGGGRPAGGFVAGFASYVLLSLSCG